jgi:DnaK suppressor protein
MDLLDESQRDELGLIHLALERIERGIFGVCEQCSERISEERLLETPWKPDCSACESAVVGQPADVNQLNLPL